MEEQSLSWKEMVTTASVGFKPAICYIHAFEVVSLAKIFKMC